MLESIEPSPLWFVKVFCCHRALECSLHSNLRAVFPDADPNALKLLLGLLKFNPQKRMTVSEALTHPFLADFNSSENPPTPPKIHFAIKDSVKCLSLN